MPPPTSTPTSRHLAPAQADRESGRQQDQTLADLDQTLSDGDQTSAEIDQEVADDDQEAADRDQVIADHQEAEAPPDAATARAYDASRKARAEDSERRDANTRTRDATAQTRLEHAAARDETARHRDLEALARDEETEAHERAFARQAARSGAADDPAVTELRGVIAALRTRAASDRARAAGDRQRAAEDRERAAQEQRQARADVERAHVDDLTGVFTRGFGLVEMQHQIERAHRSSEPLTLAFVDVDALKQVNDRDGHAAGDEVLRAVGAELKAALRSYDPIVRLGGDEFICAFTDTSIQAAARRVEEIRQALGPKASISVGLAELAPGESLAGVTARGDTELYRVKAQRR